MHLNLLDPQAAYRMKPKARGRLWSDWRVDWKRDRKCSTRRMRRRFAAVFFKRTLCHMQSRNRLSRRVAGKVQCFKMAKIDPVSPFYPTLWLEKEILPWKNLQEVQKKRAFRLWISTFVRFEIGFVYKITAGLPWKFLNFDGALRRLHSITQANSQVCFKWMSQCVS